MVNSALKFWKSFTHLHRAILFSLVFAVACACTGFTYGYLYDGDQNEGDGGLNVRRRRKAGDKYKSGNKSKTRHK